MRKHENQKEKGCREIWSPVRKFVYQFRQGDAGGDDGCPDHISGCLEHFRSGSILNNRAGLRSIGGSGAGDACTVERR